MRQQIFTVLLGFSQRQLFKNMSQIRIGFKVNGFGGLVKVEINSAEPNDETAIKQYYR